MAGRQKPICVSIRWMGLITTSLELYCLNNFQAKNICLLALPVVILKNRVTSKIGK